MRRKRRFQTQLQANQVAAGLPDFGGILIDLLPTLFNMLIGCFDPDDGQQAQEYVSQRHGDGESKYGGYQRRLCRTVARNAKQAARKNRDRLSWNQANEIAVATLDRIRNGDAQEISLVIREND